ncbi:hypothetical protein EYF80_029839 [Liparis tanakae]|uniref:Uncharacterized protein n=1 Tax=Liparis tanakae TaxID=230148 RepID=A0A4Z2H3R0_9TELE|nr:hypothetical protein EYF80_029839 [Liparis tanakae]
MILKYWGLRVQTDLYLTTSSLRMSIRCCSMERKSGSALLSFTILCTILNTSPTSVYSYRGAGLVPASVFDGGVLVLGESIGFGDQVPSRSGVKPLTVTIHVADPVKANDPYTLQCNVALVHTP